MGGIKHDEEKLPWHLLPFDATKEVIKVLKFGAAKYGDYNWCRGLNYSRLYSAGLRHFTAWWEGEDTDSETGVSHLAHLVCCALFLLAFEVRGRRALDDRPSRVLGNEGGKAQRAAPTFTKKEAEQYQLQAGRDGWEIVYSPGNNQD